MPKTLLVSFSALRPLAEVLAWQARWNYELGELPNHVGLILTEHPYQWSQGRGFDRAMPSPQVIVGGLNHPHQGEVQYLPRGGRLWLHSPGQLAGYLVGSLADWCSTPAELVRRLTICLEQVCRIWLPGAQSDLVSPGVTYAGRRLAQVGLGIRHYRVRFGFVLNVQPDLKLYEGFHPDGDPTWMTSLAREAAGTVRPGAVRTAILEQLVASFGFSTALILDQKQAFSNLVEPHACFFADRR